MASGGTGSKSAPPGIAVRHPSSSPGQRHKQGSGQAPVTRVGSQGAGRIVAGPGDEGARSIGLSMDMGEGLGRWPGAAVDVGMLHAEW